MILFESSPVRVVSAVRAMFPFGIPRHVWLPLATRLLCAHCIQPGRTHATERHGLLGAGDGQVSETSPNEVCADRADALVDSDAHQQSLDQHSGGKLNLMLASVRDDADSPRSERTKSADNSVLVGVTPTRSAGCTRRRRSGDATHFSHFVGTGAWCVNLTAQKDHRWLDLAHLANMSLGFRLKSFRWNGKHTSNFSTFGVQSNRLNYALPCADLRWDGRSWVGPVTRDAWMGSGRAVMDAFWREIEQMLTETSAEEGSLLCVLTADKVEDPQDVVWLIMRSGGTVVFRIQVTRAPGSGDELLGRFKRTPAEMIRFRRMVRTGAWRISDLPARRDHHWLHLAYVANMSLGFRARSFRKHGKLTNMFFTFGVQSHPWNYALPCADLRWDGHAWVGPVTRDVLRGRGGAVMDAFWREIEQRLTETNAEYGSLLCVLTADKVEDPQAVVWLTLRSDGVPIMNTRLHKVHVAGV